MKLEVNKRYDVKIKESALANCCEGVHTISYFCEADHTFCVLGDCSVWNALNYTFTPVMSPGDEVEIVDNEGKKRINAKHYYYLGKNELVGFAAHTDGDGGFDATFSVVAFFAGDYTFRLKTPPPETVEWNGETYLKSVFDERIESLKPFKL